MKEETSKSQSVEARIAEIKKELKDLEKFQKYYESEVAGLFGDIEYIVKTLHQDDEDLIREMGHRCAGQISARPMVYADERVKIALREWYNNHAPRHTISKHTVVIMVILVENGEAVLCVTRDGDNTIKVECYREGYWKNYVHNELLLQAKLREAENQLASVKEKLASRYAVIEDKEFFSEYVKREQYSNPLII